jgi:two-component system response regulator QseB
MDPRPRVLLVEDDRQLGPLMAELLGTGFAVTLAADGDEGLALALGSGWDALVVDRGLPGIDGIRLVASLRARGITTPVVFLTALGDAPDRAEGLGAGAEDYLVKPVDTDELAARLHAITASRTAPGRERLAVGAWVLEPGPGVLASPRGRRVQLSATEAAVLAVLAREPGRVFSRAELLTVILDADPEPLPIDACVHALRRKTRRSVVRTVHGRGYQLGDLA